LVTKKIEKGEVVKTYNDSKFLMVIIFIIITISFGMFVYFLSNSYMWADMYKLMINNLGFWSLLLIGAVFAVINKIKNPKEIVWYEMLGHFIITSMVIFYFFASFIFMSSELKDTEIWNGKMQKVVWKEHWTERKTRRVCSHRNKKGSCVSYRTEFYYIHHPDRFFGITSNYENISLTRKNYHNFLSLWGKIREKQIGSGHIGQSSFGDGRTFKITWDGQKSTVVPTAVEHEYVNYLKASKLSIKKYSGVKDSYRSYILPYSKVFSKTYGPIEVNRVLLAGISYNKSLLDWAKKVDKRLDMALVNLGAYKQVNILVYVVPNIDVGFTQALEEAWIFGKKNDVIVLLSMNDDFSLNWSSVITFAGNEQLKINLRDQINSLGGVKDVKKFTKTILDTVSQYYVRVPMKDLEYLLYDVEIPWWIFFVVLILSGAVSLIVSILLKENNIKK
jgi:hypothetical protein